MSTWVLVILTVVPLVWLLVDHWRRVRRRRAAAMARHVHGVHWRRSSC